MANNRFQFPFFQAFSGSTGAVGAGWKLNFYVSGSTSTRQATYSDVGLSVEHTNPVVADAAGRWPAIYLSALTYTVVLTDAANVVLASADNVSRTDGTGVVVSNTETLLGSAFVARVGTLTTISYAPGVNNLWVSRNGQLLKVARDFAETSSTSVTLTFDPLDSDYFDFYTNVSTTSAGPDASAVQYTPAGAGAVVTNVETKLRERTSILDYGAVADWNGSTGTNNSIVVNAKIAHMAALGGGELYFPPTRTGYYFTSAIVAHQDVSLVGAGGLASKLVFDNCDGIDLANITASVANMEIKGLHLFGVNGLTTRTGIIRGGSTSINDVLYGCRITENLIQNFLDGITLKTISNLWIRENWINNVNSGITLTGRSITCRLIDNVITRGSSGTGTENGIKLDVYTYTTGGTVKPEDVIIRGNDIYNFEYGINLNNAVQATVTENTILAQIKGIVFSTVSGAITIASNYVQMNDPLATYGIHAAGQASILSGVHIKIDGNHVLMTSTTNCDGIQVDEAGNQNQAYIDIIGNSISGSDTYDIAVYNAGDINIERNKCFSANTTSINVYSSLNGRPINIDKNYCAGDIRAPFGTTMHSQVIMGYNSGLYSTRIRGTTIISNPNTTGTTTYASLLGSSAEIPDFSATSATALGFEIIPVIMSHNVNAVGNVSATATASQIVITLETAPASQVEVHWEVIMRQKYA